MAWRAAARVVGINLVVLLGLIALLEGAARLWLVPEARPLFADEGLRTRGRPFVAPHPTRGFALIPGFEDALYRIDAAGFRAGAPVAAAAATIVALGESTTFGWGVGDADTYPARLQALFAEHGQPVRVINAGVPSYTSSQVLRYLETILRDRPPDLVLINILWNDLWYSTVLNWYPELLVYQQPPVWLSRLLQHSALLRAILLEPLPEPAQSIDRFNAAALAHYRDNLRAMLALAAAHQAPVAFVEPPFAPERLPADGLNEFHVRYTRPFFLHVAARYREALHAVAAEHAVPVLDHRLSLARGGGRADLFLDLLHPTAAGNRMMAEDLFAALHPCLARDRIGAPQFAVPVAACAAGR